MTTNLKSTLRKKARTISGVTPVAVMTRPIDSCPGRCVYCPSSPDAPKSYYVDSPANIRAVRCEFDPARQVEMRLKTLADMGHPTDKVELIIKGGSFTFYPEEYQYEFIKACYDALNGCRSPSLKEAKNLNEKEKHRCVALCVETRPDLCGERDVERLLEFGVTRVEIGVQTLDDEIHRLTGRGHGVEEVVMATRLLRDYGFKVDYHWMPGLPGSNPKHDLELSKILFSDKRFRPDGLKLYPTLVLQGTELKNWYREGKYRPYSDAEMTDLLVDIKSALPRYVRVHRLMRDIPGGYIIDGLRDMSIRGVLKKRMKERGVGCRCTRCREYGHRLRDGWQIGKPFLTRMNYDTLGGNEVFLSYEDRNETLFGLLRLRANEPSSRDGNRKAYVRELHVFGAEVPLGGRDDAAAQHKSLGEKLIREAEGVARNEFGAAKLYILSGVGVRDYYRALGYNLEGEYMVKKL